METKRQAFPRLYFVSYTDILDLLSKGNNPFEVITHLPKLFDNVQRLMFNSKHPDDEIDLMNVARHALSAAKVDEFPSTPKSPSWTAKKVKKVTNAAQLNAHISGLNPDEMAARFSLNAVGVFSSEGEFLPFGEQQCECVGVVEVWLARLLSMLLQVVNSAIKMAVSTFHDKPRSEWVFEYGAQMVLVAGQVNFTSEVNAAFDLLESGDRKSLERLLGLLSDYLGSLITLIQQGLESKNDMQKVMSLVTMDIHGRDVLEALIQDDCDTVACFAWQGQLRSWWDEDAGGCSVEVADALFQYSNEYLGNRARLVITPLTDRCYVTLTQALKLHMGGAPAGPAGTGKTETTKDLGRALGKAVYVFNCSEQMDYKSVGNIFKGLTMSGTWGCFDEFNRISLEVLSVIATQFLSISQAVRAGRKHFFFMGEDISLNPTCGMFITMNPGYTGRSELPENLKALFRPVTMVTPDVELIAENMLVAQGFHTAKTLATKMCALFRLSRSLLSNADHYDWGLRAIKSVLVVAGKLKSEAGEAVSEVSVLMGALRDFNIPKVTCEDRAVFLALLSDIFPGIETVQKPVSQLRIDAIRAGELEKLQTEDMFVDKMMQLHATLQVRHSVFIVGAAGVGKSQVWRTLAKGYVQQGSKCFVRIINPKAISTDELYGYIHPASREWKDGLLSKFMRELAQQASEEPKWLVLDGNIDPEWIESLNTVMDDNKAPVFPCPCCQASLS